MKLIRPQEKGKKADAFWWTKEHIPRYGGTHPQDIGDNTLGRNWDKRQTDKSRCQESLSKIEVRGSQILGGPGTSTQWQTDRWVEYISLSCHKKPEYTAKCHENSRLASSSSHISNQGLHTSFFLANCMPRQPNCPILQLKVNISSTLWLFSAPWPWLESPAWMQTSGQQRLRCDNQAPGIYVRGPFSPRTLGGWHLPNSQTRIASKSQQMGGSSPWVLWSDPSPKHAFFQRETVRVPASCDRCQYKLDDVCKAWACTYSAKTKC